MQEKDYLADLPQGFGRKGQRSDHSDWNEDREAQKKLDRIYSVLKNKHLSCADKCIMMVVDRMYPDLMDEEVPIQVWMIAREAGLSRDAVTKFFQAMKEHHYLDYRVRRRQDAVGQYLTECTVRAFAIWKYPERMNTKGTPKRVEHRKKCKERLKCKRCGSENILVKVVTVCKDCGEEQ